MILLTLSDQLVQLAQKISKWLELSCCFRFFENRLKIEEFYLKVHAFFDSRSHFIQVALIENARMP